MKERCTFSVPIRQIDAIYLQRSNSFKDFTPGDPVVRLRIVDSVCTLTLKAAQSGSTSIEHETSVGDIKAAESIFRALGLNLVTHVAKDRASATAEALTLHIDEVDGLGLFLEIEGLVDDQSAIAPIEAAIDALADDMGIAPEQLEPRKYDVLISQRKHAAD